MIHSDYLVHKKIRNPKIEKFCFNIFIRASQCIDSYEKSEISGYIRDKSFLSGLQMMVSHTEIQYITFSLSTELNCVPSKILH
jgi:hypothetical protein